MCGSGAPYNAPGLSSQPRRQLRAPGGGVLQIEALQEVLKKLKNKRIPIYEKKYGQVPMVRLWGHPLPLFLQEKIYYLESCTCLLSRMWLNNSGNGFAEFCAPPPLFPLPGLALVPEDFRGSSSMCQEPALGSVRKGAFPEDELFHLTKNLSVGRPLKSTQFLLFQFSSEAKSVFDLSSRVKILNQGLSPSMENKHTRILKSSFLG